jgi:hypothetical protein
MDKTKQLLNELNESLEEFFKALKVYLKKKMLFKASSAARKPSSVPVG